MSNNSDNNNNKYGDKVYYIKIVIVGDDGSGKTCLIYRLAENKFPQDYIPTIYGGYVGEFQFGPNKVQLAPWDTCGLEDQNKLRPLSYDHTNCFVLCFSISNRESFNRCLDFWYPEIQRFCPNTPIVLVGTKSDVYNNPNYVKEQLVTNSEGVEMANKIKAVQYIETSSLDNINIMKVFETASFLSIENLNSNNNKNKYNNNNKDVNMENNKRCIIN
ncbi:hypothetical protein DICPUDRAFT_149292 [Dictyostelium purpureum]|uniref:Rho GTPase n=1 Tax=Dictyostelium purpureum TaxID=5786 RepID=F0ZDB5_DICPU|nr:uncharacterized protein DICPUDRAFT_149292 [Dictyostelium purpureum]EGC38107.1 hypothetical protein DICPUDRAFT_149292 [Dictyostelium purpureum]|eukprot:XP_003285414.1 hypothetical protein DICPUDRAFT_149292 [Dictyostelium purpureum]